MDVPTQIPVNPLTRGSGRRAHLVGITGAGLKALAEVLHDRGWRVDGCDADPDPCALDSLRISGIAVSTGHSPEHLTDRPDLLIYSPAVSATHVERQSAAAQGIAQLSYVEALREISREAPSIAIAGTHGKSSTVAMVGHLLEVAGLSPTVLCGAELIHRNRNGWDSGGDTIVLEACEYRRHFLGLSSGVRCVLGIESDHFDCFADIDQMEAAYANFMGELPDGGVLISRYGCQVPAAVRSRCRTATFGVETAKADWQAWDLFPDASGIRFTLVGPDIERTAIRLQVPGRHNVGNALAALTIAATCGVSIPNACAALESFAGIHRRFERRVTRDCGLVIDDYAHHPTEIRAAITTARECYGERRLVCVFQPHQMSRTLALWEGFAEALALADRVWVLPVYAARETADDRCESLASRLAEEVTCRGTPAAMIPALDRVWPTLQTGGQSDDVILTLGAGTITRIHNEPD